MNSSKIKGFIKKRSSLFWYIKESEKENISHAFLVETILNFGNEQDTKELIRLLGLQQVASLFFQGTTNRKRINYFPQVVNFFNLYFARHAQGNFNQRSGKTAAAGQRI